MKREPTRPQFAALPFRRNAGTGIEIMLITSRDTGRWLIPKGWPAPGLSPQNSAAQEAFEEAGLVGQMSAAPIGRFQYDKKLADGSIVRCDVDVFTLEVEQQMPVWPEETQRTRRWFRPEDAAEAVQEPELQQLIRSFGAA